MKKKDDLGNIVNFLFEVGMLAKTPRSGFFFLGSGEQSVAEHVNRVIFIGYTLAMLDGTVSMEKVLKMCLLHDVAEARVSDLNYIHQKYVIRQENKAVKDITSTVPFGDDIQSLIDEYELRESKEAIIVKDADNLEWILALKAQVDIGNERANEWIVSAVMRLKTNIAKDLAKTIVKTDSNNWWFGNNKVSRGKDDWWVHRNNRQDYFHHEVIETEKENKKTKKKK
jgi:putative hydrolases of HD superfamily